MCENISYLFGCMFWKLRMSLWCGRQEKCIQTFFREQELSGEDKCYCERCGEKQPSKQVKWQFYSMNGRTEDLKFLSFMQCFSSMLFIYLLSLDVGFQALLPPQNLMYPSKAISKWGRHDKEVILQSHVPWNTELHQHFESRSDFWEFWKGNMCIQCQNCQVIWL